MKTSLFSPADVRERIFPGILGHLVSCHLAALAVVMLLGVAGMAQAQTTVYSQNFDSGTASGFTMNGLWHVTQNFPKSGGYSLGYVQGETAGSTPNGNYNTGATNSGTALSPTFSIPAGSVLAFSVSSQTEADTDYDKFKVILIHNGLELVLVESGVNLTNGGASYTDFSFDLSAYSGQTGQLKFTFYTIDDIFNDFAGVRVDNISLASTPPVKPTVTLGAASSVSTSGATLNGAINPNGGATTAQFQYGLTTSYGSSYSLNLSPNNGTSPQNVSAPLTFLTQGTTYHYRLTATNSAGTSNSLDGTFTTLTTLPVVALTATTNRQITRQTINGTVNPSGFATTAQFQYGLTTSYGTNIPVTLSPSNGTSPQNVSTNLTGLQPGTIYHYRLTATNSSGTSNTTDGTFFSAGTGDLDPAFGSNGTKTLAVGGGTYHFATSVTLQPDGRIVVAGDSNNGSNLDMAVVRLLPNGTLDTSFNGTGKVAVTFGGNNDSCRAVVVQSDGKIVIAGRSAGVSNDGDFALVRLLPDGTLDTSFNGTGKVVTGIGAGDEAIQGMALQGDGKIVVAGRAWNGSNYDYALARYNPDGTLDTSFNTTGKVMTAFGSAEDSGQRVVVQADGKILMVGDTYSGTTPGYDIGVVRYNANGSLDTGFGSGGKAVFHLGGSSESGRGLAVQPDGRIVISGISNVSDDHQDIALVRLTSAGALDSTFGSGAGYVITAVGVGADVSNAAALQGDGKILVAGHVFNANEDFAIARYNANGSLDASFRGSAIVTTPIGTGNDYGMNLAVQSNGGILVVGGAQTASGFDFAIARYYGDSIPPVAVTQAASAATTSGATLNGTANPAGLATTAWFEYGTTTSYGTSTAAQNPGAGLNPIAVNQAVTGLLDGTLYHYRIVAQNAGGTSYGMDMTFTTLIDPEIVVEEPVGLDLVDDAASVGYGDVLLDSNAVKTFTVRNTGTTPLRNLAITKDGTNAADFTVSAISTPVSAGGSTTFTVTFAPGALGARAAAIHIASNDVDENPFDIALTGTGVTPEIGLEQPAGTNLVDGSASIGYGAVAIGSSNAKTFTIKNTGTAPLAGIAVTVDGTHSGNYVVSTSGMSTTVAIGGSTTFTVTFTPTGTISSTRTAALHVASSDLNENPFDIALTGDAYSTTADADGDGLNDWAEHNYTALGFNWQVSQPALVTNLFSNLGKAETNANAAGYFSTTQVQALHVGAPLLQRHPATGVFTLTLGIEKSTTLAPASFTLFPMSASQTLINGEGRLEFQFTVPDNTAFFRLESN